MFKRKIAAMVAAFGILLVGCVEDEKPAVDSEEKESADVDGQTDAKVVDHYWSKSIESEICQTVGECRDLGDTFGDEHFISFYGFLKTTNHMSFLKVNTRDDTSEFSARYTEDEKIISASYELVDDAFVRTQVEEVSIFNNLVELVSVLFDRDKANIQMIVFQEDVYPHVDIYERKLVLPSNMITHTLQADMVRILIHEFGHMLTWNETDFVKSDNCAADRYHSIPFEECYNDDSYMTLFYEAFWKDYDEQWLQTGYGTIEERLAFYEEHKDSFVSTYATVHPYEDIAETFSHFMLTPYNDNPQTVPERKVNFFYQFPELVTYRAFVLKELKDRKDEVLSFY